VAVLEAFSGTYAIRAATPADREAIEGLIAASARGLSQGDYTEAQVEAALGSAFGFDSQLVADGTYFVVEDRGALVGCGGWSFRATRFGSDGQAGRSAAELEPATDAARIRAFFIHPDHARRGIGRALLARCESEARARGFRAAELTATLPGLRLYATCGYTGGVRQTHPLPGGLTIDFVPMRKALV
jgi:GNAT superfamily N-acetyltransferase